MPTYRRSVQQLRSSGDTLPAFPVAVHSGEPVRFVPFVQDSRFSTTLPKTLPILVEPGRKEFTFGLPQPLVSRFVRCVSVECIQAPEVSGSKVCYYVLVKLRLAETADQRMKRPSYDDDNPQRPVEAVQLRLARNKATVHKEVIKCSYEHNRRLDAVFTAVFPRARNITLHDVLRDWEKDGMFNSTVPQTHEEFARRVLFYCEATGHFNPRATCYSRARNSAAVMAAALSSSPATSNNLLAVPGAAHTRRPRPRSVHGTPHHSFYDGNISPSGHRRQSFSGYI